MAAEIASQSNQSQLPASGYPPQTFPTPRTPMDMEGYFPLEPYVPIQQSAPTTPLLPHNSLTTRWRSFVYRTWFMEVLAIFVALFFLALILVVCYIYRDHEINQTGQGAFSTPPNSTLNILVSLMRTAMLLAVASGIAQLKWLWYKKRNKLADMETFDEAARGVVGASRLLCQPHLWYVKLTILSDACNILQRFLQGTFLGFLHADLINPGD